jgi:hypothetical protein
MTLIVIAPRTEGTACGKGSVGSRINVAIVIFTVVHVITTVLVIGLNVDLSGDASSATACHQVRRIR